MILGKESDNYDEELGLFAKKIYLMYKTNSIDWQHLSHRDLVWIEAALFVDEEIKTKIKQYEIGVNVDIRALLKDLDDVQRLKAGFKSKDLIKWEDLPSNKDKQPQQKIEDDPGIRKEFLRALSAKYKK